MSDRPLHRHVSIDFATVVDTLLQLVCVFTFFCTRVNGLSNLTVEKWMLEKANLVKGAQKEATAYSQWLSCTVYSSLSSPYARF